MKKTPILSVTGGQRLLLAISLLAMTSAVSAASRQLFAEKFDVTLPVVSQQAQVIYYREHSDLTQPAGAHVHVDGEFHTTLLPGGFSAFCVRPGVHRMGAYFNQGSVYPGKTTQLYEASFSGGKTYFLRVSENGLGEPQPVKRAEAEASLHRIYRQSHMLSRASNVEACVYDREREQKTRAYTIATWVLFGPDRLGSSVITAPGREALADLALTLRQDLSRINKVSIPAHDDRGYGYLNDKLRRDRVAAIREQLINNAIPSGLLTLAASSGPDPVTSTCIGYCGSSEQQIVVHAR